MKTERLSVLMVSTSYPVTAKDWKGRFIFDMSTALSRRPDVGITLWAPPGELPVGVASALTTDDDSWLGALLNRGGVAHLLKQRPLAGIAAGVGLLRRLRRLYRRETMDVVHVNWLQNALPLLGTIHPALITVLGRDFALLRLPGMVSLLRRMMEGRKAILAPNAAWMVPELEERFGDVAEIRPIPFGVERRWFALKRQHLEKPYRWLAVTRLTQAKLGDLFTWGDGLFGAGRKLHLFGPMQEQITLPDWVHWHGSTHPEELARDWFPKAAGLVTLSRHDEGRPQVLLEAMAAGLPVVASDLFAHRDLIRHGETGWLATSKIAFANALEKLEQPLVNRRIGEAAQCWVRETIGNWDDCAARYVAAYYDLLEHYHG